MHDYLARFRRMVGELRAHRRVHVTHWHAGEPATEATIRSVEDALGHHLAPEIRAFYLQCDGLALRWWDVDAPGARAERDERTHEHPVSHLDPIWDGDPATGAVLLLPIRLALVDLGWRDTVWFEWMRGRTIELAGRSRPLLDLARSIRPFDCFSAHSMAAFLLEPDVPSPRVAIGGDYGRAWTGSRLSSFEPYLEMVLAQRGSVRARARNYFAADGHSLPPRSPSRAAWGEPAAIEQVVGGRAAVLARAIDGLWYPAEVAHTGANALEATFEDGTRARLAAYDVTLAGDPADDAGGAYDIGARVEVRAATGAWRPGVIDARFGSAWRVAHEEGASWAGVDRLRTRSTSSIARDARA
jgi:hypothetical protein